MRGRIAAAAVVAGVIVGGAAAHAIFVQHETRKVPVSRLVINLEKQLARDPRSVETHVNLARLYGMAFALRSELVPAIVIEPGGERPFYSPQGNNIPYRTEPLSPSDLGKPAQAHLKKAIWHYEAALGLDPEHLLARLGYGWVLEQNREKARAIEQYRQVIERAWAREREKKSLMFQPAITEEAAGYLIPLLDPRDDAEEIDTLKRRRQQLAGLPRAITPIAIPLEDDLAAERVPDLSAVVEFDADGSGVRREWSWISREAGWLVYDLDGAGAITSALQWFGNVSFWLFWDHGYSALAALDDNGDGELTGFELAHLAIWHDANQDGVSDPGEVRPVTRHGIEAISCRFEAGDGVLFAALSREGVRFRGGRVRPTYDVMLRSKRGTSTN